MVRNFIAIVLFAVALGTVFLYFDSEKKEDINKVESQILRKPPIVYWWDDRVVIQTWKTSDTTYTNIYEPGPTVELDTTKTWLDLDANNIDAEYIMRISDGQQFEIWRVEWCPVGDTCYNPIYYGMIPPRAGRYELPHSGIIHMRIFGLELGDKLMIWRSHPWPGYENTPEGRDSVCMIPVR